MKNSSPIARANELLDQGTPEGVDEARALLKDHADRGDTEALLALVDLHLDFADADGLSEVPTLLTRAAELGSAEAAFMLWRLYGDEEYEPLEPLRAAIDRSPSRASEWEKRAEDLGHPAALVATARRLLDARDSAGALTLLKTVLAMDANDQERNPEVLRESQAEAMHLEQSIAEEAQTRESLGQVLAEPAKYQPEELYNAALKLLNTGITTDSGRAQAMQLLDLAARGGLMVAKKKLVELNRRA
jgi:hypothetical protein